MSRLETYGRVLILLVVGGIGAAAGFHHTHEWASKNGQEGWLAWADAVVIESMAVIAGLELRRNRAVSWRSLPVLVLVGAFLLQMTAQVSCAPKTPQGWVLAATPALGFLLIVKLVLRSLPASEPVPVDEPTLIRVEQAERLPELVLPELPAPLSPVEVPVTSSMAWLPVAVRDQVLAVCRDEIQAGRPVSTEVLSSVPGLLPATTRALTCEINDAMKMKG